MGKIKQAEYECDNGCGARTTDPAALGWLMVRREAAMSALALGAPHYPRPEDWSYCSEACLIQHRTRMLTDNPPYIPGSLGIRSHKKEEQTT